MQFFPHSCYGLHVPCIPGTGKGSNNPFFTNWGETMSTDKIVLIIGLILAIIAAFVTNIYLTIAVVIVGIAVGILCVTDPERLLFLVLAITLAAVAGAIDVIPVVGPYITVILTSISILISAAAATVIVRVLVEKVTP
jgi:predicted PurR-regulated permease PerM